jgi:hypothetical protein
MPSIVGIPDVHQHYLRFQSADQKRDLGAVRCLPGDRQVVQHLRSGEDIGANRLIGRPVRS